MSASTPDFPFLEDTIMIASLIKLRDQVAPILSNEVLPYFTDHSISHSDRVVDYIGHLIKPLHTKNKSQMLTPDELQIVYASCYLHDIGMHHENISKTKVIIEAMKGELWEGLEDGARRDIIRKLHHKISAELVVNATGESSLLGFQIDINNNPRHIAALCEAHGIDTLDDRYALLCGSGGSIRLGLLSALLRIADLLDETRARANRVKAKALLLNIESQVHWWRHYYVESLIWDIKQLSVTLCFDFPAARRTEYSQIVPFIHMPILHDEIARHRSTLAPMQLNWLISFCSG